MDSCRGWRIVARVATHLATASKWTRPFPEAATRVLEKSLLYEARLGTPLLAPRARAAMTIYPPPSFLEWCRQRLHSTSSRRESAEAIVLSLELSSRSSFPSCSPFAALGSCLRMCLRLLHRFRGFLRGGDDLVDGGGGAVLRRAGTARRPCSATKRRPDESSSTKSEFFLMSS